MDIYLAVGKVIFALFIFGFTLYFRTLRGLIAGAVLGFVAALIWPLALVAIVALLFYVGTPAVGALVMLYRDKPKGMPYATVLRNSYLMLRGRWDELSPEFVEVAGGEEFIRGLKEDTKNLYGNDEPSAQPEPKPRRDVNPKPRPQRSGRRPQQRPSHRPDNPEPRPNDPDLGSLYE